MGADEGLERILAKKFKELMKHLEEGQTHSKDSLVYTVTDTDFKEKVIERSKRVPVLVDFWAEWCAPCLMLSPILERVVSNYGGKVVLAKLNVDENPVTASKYGITGIPTVILFKGGSLADQFVGLMPEEVVSKWLKRHIS